MLKSVLLKNQYILTVARLPKITLIGTKWPYSPRNFLRLKQEYQVEKTHWKSKIVLNSQWFCWQDKIELVLRFWKLFFFYLKYITRSFG